MQKVQKSGERAYATYCATKNESVPNEPPQFRGVNELIDHASRLTGEHDIMTQLSEEDFLASSRTLKDVRLKNDYSVLITYHHSSFEASSEINF